MQILGMSPARLLVNGAGAAAGAIVAEKFIVPMLPVELAGIPMRGDTFGGDDVIVGICAVAGAALANKVMSKV